MQQTDTSLPTTEGQLSPERGQSTRLLESRPLGFLLILICWCVTYLPLLGLREFEVMEPVRVMAADSMFHKPGAWIVPQVLGLDYFNKPPGYNWLIAASFTLTNSHSEFAARLPSALFTLAFACLLLWMPGTWLNVRSRILGALVFLSFIGIADAGRRAEIEAVYIALTGMAILWWLNTWVAGKSQWVIWLVPALLMGYGALVKGPILGVIFYLTIGIVLLYHGRLRDLFCVAHLVGILFIAGICLAWVYLAYRQTNGDHMLGTWAQQWLIRIKPSDDVAGSWPKCRLQTLAKLLPWFFFLPLLWIPSFAKAIPADRRRLFKACRLAAVLCFVLLNVAPGAMPRYALPTFPLFAILLGWIMGEQSPPVRGETIWKWALAVIAIALCGAAAYVWKQIPTARGIDVGAGVTVIVAAWLLLRFRTLTGIVPLVFASAILVAPGVLQHESAAYQDRYRPVAAAANAALPTGQPLYVSPQRNSMLMCVYLRQPVYTLTTELLQSPRVRYIFASETELAKPGFQQRLAGREPAILQRIPFGKFGTWIVVDLHTLTGTASSPATASGPATSPSAATPSAATSLPATSAPARP